MSGYGEDGFWGKMDKLDQMMYFRCKFLSFDPIDFFRSSRPRDLLSPHLFVIVMETFSQLIEKAVRGVT